jgi:hypothetical protein
MVIRPARNVARVGTMRNVFEVLVGDLGVDEKTILKLIFKI